MDFDLTDEQRELAALTREILAGRPSVPSAGSGAALSRSRPKASASVPSAGSGAALSRIRPTAERLGETDAKGSRFDRALWDDLAGAGVLSAGLPPEVGGDRLGVLAQCCVLIELGRAVAPVPYLSSIVTACATLAEHGTDAQRERWAVPAARGDLVLTAALPAGTVEARRSADRWLLTGAITTVPAAPYADLFLVPTSAGIFLVAPDDGGVLVERQEVAGGEDAGRLELSEVELTQDRLLEHGAAELRQRAVLGLCAAQLGVAERALELTAEHARTRIQFDRPIGAFQAVRQRLADAYIDTEAIRLTMWQAAWHLSAALPCDAHLATAKFWAAEAGHRIAHTAVHIHGGTGIDLDHPVHRYFEAATHHEFALGGATASLLDLSRSLHEPTRPASHPD
jgi:acyl-CoA dehydrogenase